MTFAHFSGRQRENEQNGMNAENSVLNKTTAEKRGEREKEKNNIPSSTLVMWQLTVVILNITKRFTF